MKTYKDLCCPHVLSSYTWRLDAKLDDDCDHDDDADDNDDDDDDDDDVDAYDT